MTNFAQIQSKIDRGRGKAAFHLGQPYTAFRIGAGSNGDFPDAWTLIDKSYPVFNRRLKSEKSIDVGISNAALFYDVVADMSPFLLGDVLVQSDAPYVPGVSYGLGATSVEGPQFNGFALAWHAPIQKSIGGRVDRRAQIFRPGGTPQPLQPDQSAYWRSMKDGDQPLVLVDGRYRLGGPGGRASYVPIGFASAYRPYGQKPFEVTGSPPGMLRPTHWFGYLPPLPGYLPAEGDTVICEDGSRYVVVQPYYQQAGVVGSQLMMDRTTAENT